MSARVSELKYRLLWLGTGYAILAVIIWVSVVPAPIQIDTGLEWQDKLFHTFAYFTLMSWFVQIYHDTRPKLLFALLFTAVGVGMEAIQAYTPERYFEVADMLANMLGVVLGYLLSLTGFSYVLQRMEMLFLKR